MVGADLGLDRSPQPENVMLVPDPERPGERRVKVLDFGIAKLSQQVGGPDGKVHTETGAMIGTPAYMAPEQCLADPNLDGKADVYALGIMLYEMLAARLPFTAQHSFDFMAAHVRGNPRPLQEVAPHAPPEVANLVHAMMAKTPTERPSMDAVVALLDQLRAALPAIWAMPRLSGELPLVGRESLALGDTALGSADLHPSNEMMGLGATVPGMPTPSGQKNRDAVTPAQRDKLPVGSQATPSAAASRTSHPTPSAAAAGAAQSTPHAAAAGSAQAASGAASPDPVAPRSAAPRWLAAVLALVLLGGVTAVVLNRLSLRTATPVTTPLPSVPPRAVRWVVRSVPAGAEVLRADGQIMGTTPWELARPAGTGETALRLHHSGYQDKTLVLNQNTDTTLELHLEPLAKAPEPIAQPPADESPNPKRRKTRVPPRKASSSDVPLLLD
jgi:hypothetical protein